MKILLLVLFLLSTAVQAQVAHPVLIEELMIDPTPPAALPEAEFIELKNVSLTPINLNGWTIQDESTTATIRTNFILQPDSFVVLCATANLTRFSAFGAALGLVGFPSLDNDGEVISLHSRDGKHIHAVMYTKSWYREDLKADGGWSLEMIDTGNPCGPANWRASGAAAGGTPGKRNAVNGINPDRLPPKLSAAFSPDSLHIFLDFNETLDSLRAAAVANYSLDGDAAAFQAAIPVAPLFQSVKLTLSTPLADDKVLAVSCKQFTDCSGNPIANGSSARVAWAKPATPGDVVINELLFNPRPGGADYIELYNRGSHAINLRQLFVTNRNATGAINAPRPIVAKDRLFFPGDFLVVTEQPEAIKTQFPATAEAAMVKLPGMPSLPDDNGTLLLSNAQGMLIDELRYDEHWHFKLISDRAGVALERIDAGKPTQDETNWHSAAAGAGYGTPGLRNSQFYEADNEADMITINPAVFSPDNDGRDDFTTIAYRFDAPGYLCTLTLFDANGRAVRHLIRNALCGLQGYFRWDGLDEKGSGLPIGVYVLVADVFNLQGSVKKIKQAIVLVRPLQ